MIELCCEYLSARCIRLYVHVLSRTDFKRTDALYSPECQGTSCSKRVQYLKFK